MEGTVTKQRRAFFRLNYPKRARPNVRIDGDLYHVSEVSEQGIRVVMNPRGFYHGLTLKGRLNLHQDKQIEVQGQVIRMEETEVILKLDLGPSFRDMVQEQRYLRQNYPSIFSRVNHQQVSK
ncbi:PilZ domain-containing protein [Vibrio olivae]|uniref:PilZ domain-containing protein n=1 Tax=Vibrio olivae TaxID=1243002 RepID=A0ABV5HJF7_9VIBR